MPGRATGTWKHGPTQPPSVDTWGLPVLARWKGEFSRQYSPRLSISCEELTRQWQRLAEEESTRAGRGKLHPQEQQAIALSVAQAYKDMDLKFKGRVSREEWIHYMMLTQYGSGNVSSQINSVLRAVLVKHPGLLGDLQKMFEVADTANTGWLTVDEIEDVYKRGQWRLWLTDDGTLTCDTDIHTKSPHKLASDIIKAMDLDCDGQISYVDFMLFCLGRRETEVTLHLYDLSNGSIPSISDWILGEHIEAIWHCGVVAFGKEYYFGGELVYDAPGETCFGKPIKTISLGKTLWRKDELHSFIVTEMKPIYSRESYDVIYNNCNHFADRICMWLVGKGIPREVSEQAEDLMKFPAARALIPLLNRWLGNCAGNAVEKTKGEDTAGPGLRDLGKKEMRKGAIVEIKSADGTGATKLGTISGPDVPSLQLSARSRRKGISQCTPNGNELEGSCWVTYFGQPTLSARGSKGKVLTELVSNSRISSAMLGKVGSEVAYQDALRAMMKSSKDLDMTFQIRCRGSASQGMKPMNTMIPGSMREDAILESPRIDTSRRSGDHPDIRRCRGESPLVRMPGSMLEGAGMESPRIDTARFESQESPRVLVTRVLQSRKQRWNKNNPRQPLRIANGQSDADSVAEEKRIRDSD